MNDNRLTHENYDRTIRDTLRYRYHFEHDDLEKIKELVNDINEFAAKEFDTRLGLGGAHLEKVFDYLEEEHETWKKLPDYKRDRIRKALRDYFGISETEPEKGTV